MSLKTLIKGNRFRGWLMIGFGIFVSVMCGVGVNMGDTIEVRTVSFVVYFAGALIAFAGMIVASISKS